MAGQPTTRFATEAFPEALARRDAAALAAL
jgi:hypothetical protein